MNEAAEHHLKNFKIENKNLKFKNPQQMIRKFQCIQ
jgi:hypothetical protein